MSGDELVLEKTKKERARELLEDVISLTLDEQHKEPAYLRPLTPIEKIRPAVSGPDDFQHSAPFSAEAQE
uniref:Polyphosphate kinase n=1 Tax=Angiostrongylus cantonensis TaxID=6313 RepID=A0A0K0D582_ANGCA